GRVNQPVAIIRRLDTEHRLVVLDLTRLAVKQVAQPESVIKKEPNSAVALVVSHVGTDNRQRRYILRRRAKAADIARIEHTDRLPAIELAPERDRTKPRHRRCGPA